MLLAYCQSKGWGLPAFSLMSFITHVARTVSGHWIFHVLPCTFSLLWVRSIFALIVSDIVLHHDCSSHSVHDYSPRLKAIITFGNCQQTWITLLGPTFLKEVINVLLWLMAVSMKVSFWLPHCLVTLDMKHNISIHCLYKCGFFTMVLINKWVVSTYYVLGTIHCHFSESQKCRKEEKIENRKHTNGNI